MPTAQFMSLFARRLLAGLLVVVAAASFLVNLSADDFDGDEYQYAVVGRHGLGHFLSEHRPLLGLQFAPLLAIAERIYPDPDPYLFHRKLAVTRLPAAVLGVITLAVATLGARAVWPGRFALLIMVGGFLAFNDWTIRYHRWGMLIFAEYLLLMTLLYFAFLDHLRDRVRRRNRAGAGLISVLVPFVYFPTLPAFATGLAGLVLIRAVRETGSAAKRTASAVRHAGAFFLAVPAYAAAAVFEPWNLARRASTADFFYPTSEDAGAALGPLLFLGRKTAALFGKLIVPQTGLGQGVDVALGGLALGLFAIAVARTVLRALHDPAAAMRDPDITQFPARLFSAWYVCGTTAGIAVLSLVGRYPYGLPRYSLYLMAPVLVLAGLGLCDVLDRIRGRSGSQSRPPLRVVGELILVLVIAASGISRVYALHEERRARDGINAALRQRLIEPRGELILYTSPTERFYQMLKPEKLDRAMLVAIGPNVVDPESKQMMQPGDLEAYLTSGPSRLQFAYWSRRTPETEHAEVAGALAKTGWRQVELIRQQGEIGVLAVATYARADSAP